MFLLVAQEVGDHPGRLRRRDAPEIEHILVGQSVFGLDPPPIRFRSLFDAAPYQAVRGQRGTERPAAELPLGRGVEGDVPYAGEHRGVDAVIERFVGVNQGNEDRLFGGDRRAQHRLAEIEIHEKESRIFILVPFDELQHLRRMVLLRLVVAFFGFEAHGPFGMQRGDHAQQPHFGQLQADAAGRLALLAVESVVLSVDGCGFEPADRDAVDGADPFGVVAGGVPEDSGRCGKHFHVVIGSQSFSQHAAVDFCAAVDFDSVANDDECYFLHETRRNLPDGTDRIGPSGNFSDKSSKNISIAVFSAPENTKGIPKDALCI